MMAAVEIALGQEPSNLEPLFNRVSIERAIITEPGIVKKISGIDEAKSVPGVAEIFINVKTGDRVKKPKSNVEKAGHIIAVGNTLKEAEAAVAECKRIISIDISSDFDVNMESIRAAARERFNKSCYVCKECDGEKCASAVPGMGGISTGETFRRNLHALNEIKINTRVIHDVTDPDTSMTFFGQRLSLPVMAAPITGTETNMGGAMTEMEYASAVIKGCLDAGSIGWVGDGASPEKYKTGLQAIEQFTGNGIAIFKPRASTIDIIKRIRAAEKAGVIAVGLDIDAVVFKTMELKGQTVGPKSLSELKDIIQSTSLPFILKGIMHPKDAEMAVKAGAHAIVVSNHGGRVLDQMRGTMDILPSIVRAVKGEMRVLIDGGFRNGVDILKGIASGADAVLIGRPVAIAAVGMEDQGVAFYIRELQKELKKAMILTGCASIADINAESIFRMNEQIREYQNISEMRI
jgi:isopentenyl diphosphate isomerase/L-lactate dehydrogenase-like FMN-dependent dehydrogenase